MSGKAQIPTQQAGRIQSYEPPTVTVIGPLSKITLGSGGTKNDGLNQLRAKD
jgi:hypothetical protein